MDTPTVNNTTKESEPLPGGQEDARPLDRHEQYVQASSPRTRLLGPTVVVRDRAKDGELQGCIEKALLLNPLGDEAGDRGIVEGSEALGEGTGPAQNTRDSSIASPEMVPFLSSMKPEDIHVLVVDDEMMSRTVVSSLLKKFKYTVTTAEDGAEAMELLQSSPSGTYHLVLTDVRMPKLNGIELLRYIRSEETLRSVPVVMMSSYDAGDVVCACEESGAEEYLVKPVTQKEVANIWQHVLKKREEATVVPQSAGVDDVCKKDASVAEVETSELEHEHKQRAEEERRRRQQVENRKIMESLREQSTITGEFLRMMRDKRMREFEMLKGQVMLLQEDCEAVSHLSEWDEEDDADGHGHGSTRKRKAGLGEESLSADKELIDFSWLNTRGLDASYFAKIHRSAPQLCKGLRGDKPTYNADTKEKSGALHLTPSTEEHLRDFAMSLNAVSQRSKLVVESTIRSGNMANPQEMVCYADFDADDSHFATVSVSRSVKVFDYASIIDCPESLQFPIWQATTRSKLSSVSWNAYLRSHLITSDYDGAIQLWDVASGLKSELAQFEEHEKRVWSIDFSRLDPMQFASASDDATVKIWSLQQSNTSVSSINLPANACSVHYNPRRATMLSVACANHACYVFDTRKSDSPLALLGGATRAVSYIKHLDGDTVLGASTDNAIRSWDLRKMGETSVDGTDNGSWRMPLQPEEVYTGHLNERNFVGLTVDNDGYIASGSEDNSVVIYYYKFPFEVCRYDLGKDTGKTKESGQEQIQDREPKRDKTKAFTSSVCWARGGKSLLVGNSEGCLALLRLQ